MKETILAKIRKKRSEKKYTQEFMSYRLGITQSHYAKMENGKVTVKDYHLVKIVKILEMDYDELQLND